jgi:rubredoxin
VTEVVVGQRAWMCLVCGFMYFEALGLPEEGIAPGTSWEEIPDSWECPDCGATKDDFVMAPM